MLGWELNYLRRGQAPNFHDVKNSIRRRKIRTYVYKMIWPCVFSCKSGFVGSCNRPCHLSANDISSAIHLQACPFFNLYVARHAATSKLPAK